MNSESPGDKLPGAIIAKEMITSEMTNEESPVVEVYNTPTDGSQGEETNEQTSLNDSSSYILNVVSDQDYSDTCHDISQLFRTESPSYQEVIKLLYQECVNNAKSEAVHEEDITFPKIDDIISTMKNFIYQSQDESQNSTSNFNTLIQNLQTQLERRVNILLYFLGDKDRFC